MLLPRVVEKRVIERAETEKRTHKALGADRDDKQSPRENEGRNGRQNTEGSKC